MLIFSRRTQQRSGKNVLGDQNKKDESKIPDLKVGFTSNYLYLILRVCLLIILYQPTAIK
jgi:hypothetical protein